MFEQTGVIIVAYQPDVQVLDEKLRSIATQIDNIIVVNNGSNLEIDLPRVTVENLNENKGIAYAQNKGVEILTHRGVLYSFFLDQDSELPDNFFKIMLGEWEELKAKDEKIALLSPLIQDKNFGKYLYPIRLINGRLQRTVEKPSSWPVDQVIPISSGILISLSAFQQSGGLTSELFIDWVDFQLDFRLLMSGYSTYATNRVTLQHVIGKKDKRKFFTKNIYPTNYPLFREYYFARNAIIIMREFKNEIPGVKEFVKRALKLRFLFIIYENQKFRRFWTLCRAMHDGRKFPISN